MERKISKDLLKRAKKNEPEALLEIFVMYRDYIINKANYIHNKAPICSEEDLKSCGMDAVSDYILACDINKAKLFDTLVKSYISEKMLGDLKKLHIQVKDAVDKVEAIYEKSYTCDDVEMTEDIIDRLKPPYADTCVDKSVEDYVRSLLRKAYKFSYSQMVDDVHDDYERETTINERLARNHTLGKVNDDPIKETDTIYKGNVKIRDSSSSYEDDYSDLFRGYDLSAIGDMLDTYTKPYQNATIRLKYGLFPDKVMSYDEVCKMFLIPAERLESIVRKKIKGAKLDDCENNILCLLGWEGEFRVPKNSEIARVYGCDNSVVGDRIHSAIKKISIRLWFYRKYGQKNTEAYYAGLKKK